MEGETLHPAGYLAKKRTGAGLHFGFRRGCRGFVGAGGEEKEEEPCIVCFACREKKT